MCRISGKERSAKAEVVRGLRAAPQDARLPTGPEQVKADVHSDCADAAGRALGLVGPRAGARH